MGAYTDFFNYIVDMAAKIDGYDSTLIEYENIPKYKKEIYERWGKYIPELKEEIRNSKLEQLLEK